VSRPVMRYGVDMALTCPNGHASKSWRLRVRDKQLVCPECGAVVANIVSFGRRPAAAGRNYHFVVEDVRPMTEARPLRPAASSKKVVLFARKPLRKTRLLARHAGSRHATVKPDKSGRAVFGAGVGGALGVAVGGPVGAAVGAALGAVLGSRVDDE
jgi:hypothetical protein